MCMSITPVAVVAMNVEGILPECSIVFFFAVCTNMQIGADDCVRIFAQLAYA